VVSTARTYLRILKYYINWPKSQFKAYSIIKQFKPHAAVGVGGYASGPTLKMAGMMGVPTLIQEQNSYAGVTNKLWLKSKKDMCCLRRNGEVL